MKTQKILRRGLLGLLLVASLSLPACDTDSIGVGGVVTEAENCNYEDNLDESAETFISRCRQGGIHREFSGEYYGKTLREISKDNSKAGKKARKLLKDRRFIK